jgi:hypothetical protein
MCALFNHPNTRQFSLHLIKGYSRMKTSAQGSNRCWENWVYQALTGRELKSHELDHYRKNLSKPWFQLVMSLDRDSLYNLLVPRGEDGGISVTSSVPFSQETMTNLLQQRFGPNPKPNMMGGIVELSLLAILFGFGIDIHMDQAADRTDGSSAEMSIEEKIVKLTPSALLLRDSTKRLHAYYHNVDGYKHYENLCGVADSAVLGDTLDCAAILADAKTRIASVATVSASITAVPAGVSMTLDSYRRKVNLPASFSSDTPPAAKADSSNSRVSRHEQLLEQNRQLQEQITRLLGLIQNGSSQHGLNPPQQQQLLPSLPESQRHSPSPPLIDLVSTIGSAPDSNSQQVRQGIDGGSDDSDEDANDQLGGGADAHVNDAALKAQIEAAITAAKQILLKGNDVCSTHVFNLKQQTLLDIDPDARPARVESTILTLRGKLEDIINTPITRGHRTKKANGLLQRFLSFIGGNVSLRSDDTCSSSQADVPSPSNLKFSQSAQCYLLNEY